MTSDASASPHVASCRRVCSACCGRPLLQHAAPRLQFYRTRTALRRMPHSRDVHYTPHGCSTGLFDGLGASIANPWLIRVPSTERIDPFSRASSRQRDKNTSSLLSHSPTRFQQADVFGSPITSRITVRPLDRNVSIVSTQVARRTVAQVDSVRERVLGSHLSGDSAPPHGLLQYGVLPSHPQRRHAMREHQGADTMLHGVMPNDDRSSQAASSVLSA